MTTRVDTGAIAVRTYARNVFDAFSGTPTFTGLALKVVAPGGGPIVDSGRIRVDFADGSILLADWPPPDVHRGRLRRLRRPGLRPHSLARSVPADAIACRRAGSARGERPPHVQGPLPVVRVVEDDADRGA